MLEHFDDIFAHVGLLDASWNSWELKLENLEGQDGKLELKMASWRPKWRLKSEFLE